MIHSQIKVLSVEDCRATVSTDGLYRIVKMPDEIIVGELTYEMKSAFQTTRDGYGVHGAWRIAMSYDLCRIAEQKGIYLNDIAIEPIGKDCCPWCGAHGLEDECPTEYECGTFLDAGWGKAGYSESLVREEDCVAGERLRHEVMVAKSAALRKLLVDAGEDVNADKIWLFDGRPFGRQFLTSPRAVRRRLASVERRISRSATRTRCNNP